MCVIQVYVTQGQYNLSKSNLCHSGVCDPVQYMLVRWMWLSPMWLEQTLIRRMCMSISSLLIIFFVLTKICVSLTYSDLNTFLFHIQTFNDQLSCIVCQYSNKYHGNYGSISTLTYCIRYSQCACTCNEKTKDLDRWHHLWKPLCELLWFDVCVFSLKRNLKT